MLAVASPNRSEADALPMAAGWQPQRRAAANNHAVVLQAARELLEAGGTGAVNVREIAAAAGVGVGTIYRRFGGKAGLIAAVVGERERDLQDAILAGPPPLGRGASPARRLTAFLEALADLTDENLNVLLATDTASPGRRRIGAYASWRLHVMHLLRELRPELGDNDVAWYADLLLAPLDPSLFAEHRRERSLSLQDIRNDLRRLVHDVAPQG